MNLVDARHYIVSTNNAYFGHPNDEAIARVTVKGGRPTIWFDCDTPKNRHWSAQALTTKYGHVTK